METLKVDIAVIGSGGAGLSAAVAAAEKGADVIILEKRRLPGGNSAMAGGIFAAESQVQKQRMIDARRDVLFRTAMDYAHWKINPLIVRAFVDKSGDTIRWLQEKNVNFSSLPAMYPNQAIRTMHLPKKGGAEIINALTEKCKELGIKLLLQTAAKKLLLATKGQIGGVIASTNDEEIMIEANSIIIASGGYGGSKKLLKRFYADYHENMYTVGLPHTGDGLLMTMEIGAATEGLGILQLSGPDYRGNLHVRSVAQEPNTIWLNKNGARFTDESITFDISLRGNAVDRQPEKISYTLFDEKIKNKFDEEGLAQLSHSFGMARAGTTLNSLSKSLQIEADKGKIKIADSLDEIAKWMGVDPRVLKSTIEEYNTYCYQGHDRVFVKDAKFLQPLTTPPYYAIKCYSCFTDTIGGIKVNQNMEVLNQQDISIRGLYAAGVAIGGWESETYCYLLSGSTFGFAINSGRIAGENACNYLKNN